MVPVESSSKPAFTGHQKALVLVRQADGPWREGGRVIGRETEDCQSAPSFPMAYGGRRGNASRSSYIQESGFSFLKLFKGSQIHEFECLNFVKKILSALGENPGVDLGRTTFSLELLTTPGATQLEKQLLE